jgi:anti-anti-sigma factor
MPSPREAAHRRARISNTYVDFDGTGTVVRLQGEHDRTTAKDVSAALAEAVADETGDVVVDMADLAFMDASTVAELQRAQQRLDAGERRLLVRSPPRCARIVLQACDLEHLIEPVPPSARRSGRRTALETWVEVPRDPADARRAAHPACGAPVDRDAIR